MSNTRQKALLAIGIGTGIVLAYVDSLPTWNDAGIMAGSLALTSGILTLVGYRRPWLMALGVGLWLPLRDLYAGHDLRTPFVFLFPLAGAYAGYLVYRGISREGGAL